MGLFYNPSRPPPVRAINLKCKPKNRGGDNFCLTTLIGIAVPLPEGVRGRRLAPDVGIEGIVFIARLSEPGLI